MTNKPEICEKTNLDSNELFGVNSETKDLNVCQLYSFLLNKYNGNRNDVSNYIQTLGSDHVCGFLHTKFLNKSFTNISDDDSHTSFCQKLESLSNMWRSNDIVKNNHTADEFSSNTILREAYCNSIVTLKYVEQFGARFWHNVWAKEMRGTVLFVHPETDQVKCLSYKLERGAEVMTKMTKMDTSDIKQRNFDILDQEQQDTCKRLISGETIDLHLTSKADGSLLIINSFSGSALKIISPVIELFGTTYTKLWAQQSLKLSGGKRLLIPATQGTFVESGFMASYMVTSMLIGSNIVTRDSLKIFESFGKTYTDAWSEYGDEFIKKFLTFTFFDDLSESQAFCFEAICRDRRGLFGDNTHTELACSYDRDRLIFLGTSLSDKRFYIPHSCYSEKYFIPFEEPLWWKISHSDQVNSMLESLEKIIVNVMTRAEFLTTFPPENKSFDKSDENIIDCEGFVAMKIASMTVSDPDHSSVCSILKIPRTIYSKIKTNSYYRIHNFHTDDVPFYVEISRTAGKIFPLTQKIAGIYNTIVPRLHNVKSKTMSFLDFTDPNNIIIPLLHKAYQESLAQAEKLSEQGSSTVKIPKNPLIGFEKRPKDVQCRMALNFKGFDFGDYLLPIYLNEFPEIDTNNTNLKSALKILTLTLRPWDDGYFDRIKDLTPTSPSIKDLVSACVGIPLTQ